MVNYDKNESYYTAESGRINKNMVAIQVKTG